MGLGIRFRVSGSKFQVQSFRFKVLDFGLKVIFSAVLLFLVTAQTIQRELISNHWEATVCGTQMFITKLSRFSTVVASDKTS